MDILHQPVHPGKRDSCGRMTEFYLDIFLLCRQHFVSFEGAIIFCLTILASVFLDNGHFS